MDQTTIIALAVIAVVIFMAWKFKWLKWTFKALGIENSVEAGSSPATANSAGAATDKPDQPNETATPSRTMSVTASGPGAVALGTGEVKNSPITTNVTIGSKPDNG